VVGTLPEVAETEPNDAPDKPQAVEPRAVVSGKLSKNGDADGFAVELKQGQTLVAAVQANAILGSPIDSVLQVCQLVERRSTSGQLAGVEAFVAAQNHDAVGLDPQVVFTAPRDGRYLVRLFAFPSEPNSTIGFAGGDNFLYRLTLTTGGFLDHVLPLALPADATQAQTAGWNIPQTGFVLDAPAASAAAGSLEPPDGALAWLFHPEMAGAWLLPRIARVCIVAGDSSDTKQPQEVKLPVTISGGLDADGDEDAFAFAGAKDQKLRVQVESKSLGFPLDAHVALLDHEGKMLAEQDDTGRDERDPLLNATLPADGQYRVVIRDLHDRGGPRMAYRLTIETPQPDFAVSLAADSFLLAADKPLEIPLNVVGREGFNDPLEVRVLGLPAGVTAEPLTVTPTAASGESSGRGRRGGRRGGNQQPASNAKLVLKADPATITPGGGPIRIEARCKGADQPELVRSARFSLALPLADKHWAAWLTVKK
jgi:hypothetical protein